MKKRSNEFLWAIIPLIVACLICTYGIFSQGQSKGCLPIEGFSESDLVGKWQSGISGDSDTLILRSDGKYQQRLVVDSQQTNYVSDWLPWHVELSEAGIPYLHLTGMRLCVYWEGYDCSQLGDRVANVYDPCQKEPVKMQGEGILIVQGYSKPLINLKLLPMEISIEGGNAYSYIGN
jgi:hypothetical protein